MILIKLTLCVFCWMSFSAAVYAQDVEAPKPSTDAIKKDTGVSPEEKKEIRRGRKKISKTTGPAGKAAAAKAPSAPAPVEPPPPAVDTRDQIEKADAENDSSGY